MQAVKFAEYTAAGAAAGALFTGLGAVVLHPAAPDTYHRREAATAGLVGGAVTHAAIGLLSAFDGERGMGHHLRHLGRSLPVAAILSPLVGGGVLAAAGHTDVPPLDALVLSGIIGGAIIGTVAALGTTSAILCCTKRPTWTRLAQGDLGLGDALMAEPAERGEP